MDDNESDSKKNRSSAERDDIARSSYGRVINRPKDDNYEYENVVKQMILTQRELRPDRTQEAWKEKLEHNDEGTKTNDMPRGV